MTDFHPTPILVPTDLSSASADAVRVARQIATSDESVIVLYVGLDHDLIAPGNIWGMDGIPPDDAGNRGRRLDEWVTENGLGAVRQEIRCGDPGMEICALASACHETGLVLVWPPEQLGPACEEFILRHATSMENARQVA